MFKFARFVSASVFSLLKIAKWKSSLLLNKESKFKLSVTTSQKSGLQLRREISKNYISVYIKLSETQDLF